ncbi:hypothetical protein KBW71_00110 [Hydrogenophaga aromaticivorans]|uniref:hypothetical protein n=1 Tax=Hydrogenophaga aromaticivorans TaxID=2610898 RepID=UPI001B3619F6|nr:hypothetical protein [Hydrogenophaga aromaticivorans]MBQ0916852.1 hypothetical protein [Hydrogenophaga aromaticivorans]
MRILTPFLILIPGLNVLLAAFSVLGTLSLRPRCIVCWLVLSPLALATSILMGPPLAAFVNDWLVHSGQAGLPWLVDWTQAMAEPVGEWINSRVGTSLLNFAELKALPKADPVGFLILVEVSMFVGFLAPFRSGHGRPVGSVVADAPKDELPVFVQPRKSQRAAEPVSAIEQLLRKPPVRNSQPGQ